MGCRSAKSGRPLRQESRPDLVVIALFLLLLATDYQFKSFKVFVRISQLQVTIKL